jgi:hypothetical protein
MHPYPQFIQARKLIPAFPGWSQPEAESGYSWFDVSLEIEGVVEAGFIFHGGYLRDRPDCNVTFELRVGKRPGRPCVPLARICWKSLKGGHSNDRRWESAWAGKRVPSTHYHAFELNWDEERQRMKGLNLPVAMPIAEPLETYEALRFFSGKALRISNIDVVGLPKWEYRLL